MAAEHLTKGRGIFLLFIISLAVGVIGWGSPASKPELCKNPPAGNPNLCHVYTWNSFPQDTGFTPTTGLFNNDTSYYFQHNMTGLTEFETCVNLVSENDAGANYTLTPQYLPNGATTWINLDKNNLGAGSVNLQGLPSNTTTCSSRVGNIDPTLSQVICGALSIGSCELRIAGNTPIVAGSPSDSLTLSDLSIIFFSSAQSITNIVTCASTTPTTTTLTVRCMKPITFTSSQAITIGWWATNQTSTGVAVCTLSNCIRTGTGTCTILANTNTCTMSASFSPSFTGTIRAFIDQSTVAGTGGPLTLAPPDTYNILT